MNDFTFVKGESATGLVLHGGAGSGDFGHAGRPGERGGAEPGHGGPGAPAPEHGMPAEAHAGHGEHGHGGHEHHHPMASNLANVNHELGHVQQVIQNLPKVAARFVAQGGARAAQAGTSEGVEHAVSALHEHHAAAKAAAHDAVHSAATSGAVHEAGHAGVEEATGGGHEAAHGGHGEHGGHGHGDHALGAFAEATGAILGSKVSSWAEKHIRNPFRKGSKTIEQKQNELYEQMKKEHGALAPYLHLGATAATLGIKGALAHALAGPAGAVAGTAFGHLSEHMVHAAHEGLQGFGGYAMPGVGYASLLAAHHMARAFEKTGLQHSTFAQHLGNIHRALANSRVGKGVTHLVEAAEHHLENLTGLHLLKEGRLIHSEASSLAHKAGSAAKATGHVAGKAGRAVWAGLHLHPQGWTAPGHFGKERLPLQTANTATGKTIALGGDLDADHPAIHYATHMLKHSIQAIMEHPLWHDLNTENGAKLVTGLLSSH